MEIPVGKRKPLYRFFEMVPALLSYGAILLLVVLSLLPSPYGPILAATYLLLFVFTLLVKAAIVPFQITRGNRVMAAAKRVDWVSRLRDLDHPEESLVTVAPNRTWRSAQHRDNLERIAADPGAYPKPSDLYQAVIIATYNESNDILEPTVQSVIDSDYDSKHIILMIAYEARGGADTKATVMALKAKYKDQFAAFLTSEHPKDLPNEVIGKGGNITFGGHILQEWLDKKEIEYKNVLVTTLDSDNHPHPVYFSYVAYEYIVNPYRKQRAFQPVALYFTNIWDVPAPARVLATGNSFWNITTSLRPHTLRNFAAHSQAMDALVEMNFWSVRTIVEDGHQYWRSYFHFKGDYSVVPIHVPIDQDAVLSTTYVRTLKAQFIQIRRWAYGASDVPFVAVQLFTRKRVVPFWKTFAQFARLIDGHLTWAVAAVISGFGAWVPLLLNSQSSRSIAAHELPEVISFLQRIALVALVVSIFWSLKLLPPRPARYKRHRTIGMVLQWFLLPLTSIGYSAASAFYSQTRLLLGKYFERFEVTDKAVKTDTGFRK